MSEFIAVLLVVLAVLALCFLAMAIGLIFRGKIIRGGCGSSPEGHDDKVISCDTCSKKAINLCEDDDTMGLAGVSSVATWGRFKEKSSD